MRRSAIDGSAPEDYDNCFAMERIDKRRCKQMSAHPNSLITKNGNDVDDRTEHWRREQSRDQPFFYSRADRMFPNPSIDVVRGYQCSVDDSYRSRKHHGMSSGSRTKYLVPSPINDVYRIDGKNRGILRTVRNNVYPSNVAVVRKTRYKNECDDADGDKYVDPELAGDDDVEEETGEEVVDEERDNGSEYSDKECYEVQELDDEIDDESDVLERHVERMKTQRKIWMEPELRNQRTTVAEPSHPRRGQKITMGKDLERCCHTVAERDNVDVPTEDEDDEDDVRDALPYVFKKSPWRHHPPHQDRESRNQPRNVVERYSNFNKTPSGSGQQTRRPRTTKPETESSMTSTRVPYESIRQNRCSNCGVVSGQTTKTTASRNASCRIQDNRYLTRLPIGDEGEMFKDSEPIISYPTKFRRSKETRSPTYDPREEFKTMDAELGTINKSCRTKNSRELSSGHGERTRHSLRANNRHDRTTCSKSDNRCYS